MTHGEKTWRFAVAGIVFGVLALVAALQEHWWLFGYCIPFPRHDGLLLLLEVQAPEVLQAIPGTGCPRSPGVKVPSYGTSGLEQKNPVSQAFGSGWVFPVVAGNTKSVAGLLVLAGGLSLDAATASAATPVSGPAQLWGNLNSGNGFKSIFTGAIGDSGLSIPATAQGKPSKKNNTGYRLFVLKKGTIFFNTKQVDAAQNNDNAPPTTENSTTCSFTFVNTDPVTIISGTKAYVGITGSFNVTISYAAVLPMKNGKCKMNANPTATIGT